MSEGRTSGPKNPGAGTEPKWPRDRSELVWTLGSLTAANVVATSVWLIATPKIPYWPAALHALSLLGVAYRIWAAVSKRGSAGPKSSGVRRRGATRPYARRRPRLDSDASDSFPKR